MSAREKDFLWKDVIAPVAGDKERQAGFVRPSRPFFHQAYIMKKASVTRPAYARPVILAATIAALLGGHSASAVNFTWDLVSGDGPAITAGSGIWDTASQFWNNAGNNVAWANGNTAVFGGVDGAYAIDIGADGLSSVGLSFLNSGYTLGASAPRTLLVTPVSGNNAVISVLSGKSATIGTNVTVSRVTGGFTFSGGGTVNIAGTAMATGTAPHDIRDGTTVVVQAGGLLNLQASPVIGANSGTGNLDGNLIIDGGTMTVTTATSNIVLGNLFTAGSNTTAVFTINSGSVNLNSAAGNTNGLRFGSLTQSNGTITGTVNLNGGTLTVPSVHRGAVSGTGSITSTFNFNGGLLQANRTNTTFMQGHNAANVLAGGARISTSGFDITIGQALLDGGGGGGLEKTGNGVLTLSGASTYTGPTNVNTGTLAVGHATALGTTASPTNVANGAMLLLNNGVTVTGETANIAGVGLNSLGALAAAPNANATWAGDINLGGLDGRVGAALNATLNITGAILNGNNFAVSTDATTPNGTVILSGTGSNYTGVTQVVRGTLKLGASNVLPVTTILDVHSGPTANQSTFDLNGFSQTVGALRRSDTMGPGTVTNTGAAPGTLTVSGDTSTTFNGTITGGANLSLTKGGSSLLTLTGTNTYDGITTINGGTLQLGNGGTTGSIGAGAVVSNATLDLNRSDAFTFANHISGTGGVSVSGSGTVTLSGTNTYTGPTDLNFGRTNLTGTFTSNVTVGFSDLGGEGSTTGSLTFLSSSTLFFDPATPARLTAASINAAGATVQLSLSAPSLGGTGIVILEAAGGILGTAGVGGNFQFNGRGTVYLNGTNTQLLFDYTPALLKWRGDDALNPTVWDVDTTFNWRNGANPDKFIAGDAVTFDDTAASYAITVITPLTPGTMTFHNSANTYTLNGLALGGPAGLIKNGTGTVAIANDNTFTGGTTINAGTIQLGDGFSPSGTLGTGAVTNNGALSFNYGASNMTFSNPLGGNGIVTKDGIGTLFLNGPNTFAGLTVIVAGTVQVNNGGSLGTGAVLNDGALVFNRNGTYTIPNAIGGAGSVNSQNGGLLTLGTANTYSGTTTVTSGAVLVTASSGVLGNTTGGSVVSGGGTIGLVGGVNYAGEEIHLSGTGMPDTNFFFPGSINQRGALQSVSGNNTWGGNIIIDATNTRIGVQDGAQLTLTGTITEAAPGMTLILRAGTATAGLITLSGAGSSITRTDVYGSAVRLGVHNGLAINSSLFIGTNGVGTSTFDLNGFNQTVTGLSQVGNTAPNNVITNTGAADSTLTLNGTVDLGFMGTISNGGTNKISLVKNGTFKQTIQGPWTYTGPTDIVAGTLTIGGGGSLTATESINISGGATFETPGYTLGAARMLTGGDGTLAGSITGAFTAASGATVSPGLGAGNTGTLSFSAAFNLNAGAHLAVDLDSATAGTGYDQLITNGNVTLAGDLAGSTLSFDPVDLVDVFYLILNNGTTTTTTGTFGGVPEGGSVFIGTQEFQISYKSDFGGAGFTVGGTGNDVALLAVPEPTAMVSLLGGLGLMLGLRRRNARHA